MEESDSTPSMEEASMEEEPTMEELQSISLDQISYEIPIHDEINEGVLSNTFGGSEERGGMQMVVSKTPNIKEPNASTQGSEAGTYDPKDYTNFFTTNKVFQTAGEVVQWIRSVRQENGLVIITTASDLNPKNRNPNMRFGCERGGKYRKFVTNVVEGKEIKRRTNSTSTKKCECPFEMRAVMGISGWTVKVRNGLHNHPAARTMEGHSFAGRLSTDESSMLVEMSKCLVKPKEILNIMKSRHKSNASTMKTIYNARQRHRVLELAGRTQMQQLMTRLRDHNYISWHRTSETTSVLTDLWWSHPQCGHWLHAFPTVLILDSTYKTNRYKFPLLEMVGVTTTKMTFSVAFCFMSCEKEDNFVWALEKLKSMTNVDRMPEVIVIDRELALMNAVEKCFPSATHLLCRYHIACNVRAKCKPILGPKKWEVFKLAWDLLVASQIEQNYQDNLSWMERNFAKDVKALKYIQDSWLLKYKEKFVAA